MVMIFKMCWSPNACYGLASCVHLVNLFSGECPKHLRWEVNIGSGNCMLPSGNNPSPEPMLTQIYVTNGRVKYDLYSTSGLILGLCPANERRRYFVTTSLIGWAQTLNQPWIAKLYAIHRCNWSCYKKTWRETDVDADPAIIFELLQHTWRSDAIRWASNHAVHISETAGVTFRATLTLNTGVINT